jgi:hypothetical protein
LYRQLLDCLPGRTPRPEEVPEPMASLLAAPPSNLWLPEAHVMGVSLIIGDHYRLEDDAYLAWLRDVNRRYFSSVVYRILMSFVSPGMVFPRAGARWAAVHEGSTLAGRLLGAGEGELELTFPPGLFAPLLLQHFTAVFQAAFEHSNASRCAVTLDESSDVLGHYRVTWR